MNTVSRTLLVCCLCMFAAGAASAVDRAGYDELTKIMDSAKVMRVEVFAPKSWEKAQRAYKDATQAIEREKEQKSINREVGRAREHAENALKATEVCRLTLREYLPPREKAMEAKAPTLVPELYEDAERQFMKATEKVESGDVKGALKEAEKASPLFDQAELQAIREEVIGPANRLIDKAIADDGEKFALSTLDKARTAREKADAVIVQDRYNREEAMRHARQAEYEARHASNIAQSVRALNRNDQAWEKLMLVYEIQMDQVGRTIGLDHLPFDNGPQAAADTLILYIKAMQERNADLEAQYAELHDRMSSRLTAALKRTGDTPSEAEPLALAEQLDTRLAALLDDNAQLERQLDNASDKLTTVSQEREQVAAALESRVEQEEKFKKAKRILNPSEGEVLFNSSNDIVLRLHGLSFDVGKSNIKDEHIPLLKKAETVIQMFPDSRLVVEGHTDASGDPGSNVTLSQKRAYAVMQYLRQSLLIPAERISSIGFGSDKPVASNKTADGRAKNRRIDIIIMH